MDTSSHFWKHRHPHVLTNTDFKVHIYGCAHHTQFHIVAKCNRSDKSLFCFNLFNMVAVAKRKLQNRIEDKFHCYIPIHSKKNGHTIKKHCKINEYTH